MALNPSGAISLAGPVAGQSIALELGLSPTATISLNDTAVRALAGVPSGAIIMPTNFWGKSAFTPTQRAIFAFGRNPTAVTNAINLVSNTGVMAGDTPGTGTARSDATGAGYGGDKAIFGFGATPIRVNITNLVSNTGVVATDTSGVGTARDGGASAGYGTDKAIFGFGRTPASPVASSLLNITNLVSNTGVMAGNTPGVGSARQSLSAAGYGGDKALFALGTTPSLVSITNLVSNTGVVAADTPGVPGVTARLSSAGAGYGGDKAIFTWGSPGIAPANYLLAANLVSNTGVMSANNTIAGPARASHAGAVYGGDKAIFGFGFIAPLRQNATNLVSNTGVVASAITGIGALKSSIACATYSFT
jgi:hypothetical protein